MKIGVWCLLAVLALSSCAPKRDPDLVGKWRGSLMKQVTWDFRPDGSYTHEAVEVSYGTDRNVRFFDEGTWRTSSARILLKARRCRVENAVREVDRAEKHRRYMLNNETAIPYKWVGKDKWWASEVGAGYFVREKAPPSPVETGL